MTQKAKTAFRGLAIEGTGAAYFPSHQPVPLEVGVSPSWQQSPVRTIVESWLHGSNRFSDGALYNLSKLKSYPKKEIRETISSLWGGTDLEEIKKGLVAAGVARSRTPIGESKEASVEEHEKDTAMDLLREAVVHVPASETFLRARIEAFFLRG